MQVGGVADEPLRCEKMVLRPNPNVEQLKAKRHILHYSSPLSPKMLALKKQNLTYEGTIPPANLVSTPFSPDSSSTSRTPLKGALSPHNTELIRTLRTSTIVEMRKEEEEHTDRKPPREK